PCERFRPRDYREDSSRAARHLADSYSWLPSRRPVDRSSWHRLRNFPPPAVNEPDQRLRGYLRSTARGWIGRSSFLLFREGCAVEPEPLHELDDGNKIGKIARFPEIAIGPEVITMGHVGSRFRAREYDDWNSSQFGVRLDFSQYFASALAREIQV